MSERFDPETISAYLDDQLSSEERAEVRHWIESDPEAARMVQEFRQVREGLSQLPKRKLDAGFSERVLQAIRETQSIEPKEKPTPASVTTEPISNHRYWIAGLVSLAAIVLVMFILNVPGRNQPTVATNQALERDADESPADSERGSALKRGKKNKPGAASESLDSLEAKEKKVDGKNRAGSKDLPHNGKGSIGPELAQGDQKRRSAGDSFSNQFDKRDDKREIVGRGAPSPNARVKAADGMSNRDGALSRMVLSAESNKQEMLKDRNFDRPLEANEIAVLVVDVPASRFRTEMIESAMVENDIELRPSGIKAMRGRIRAAEPSESLPPNEMKRRKAAEADDEDASDADSGKSELAKKLKANQPSPSEIEFRQPAVNEYRLYMVQASEKQIDQLTRQLRRQVVEPMQEVLDRKEETRTEEDLLVESEKQSFSLPQKGFAYRADNDPRFARMAEFAEKTKLYSNGFSRRGAPTDSAQPSGGQVEGKGKGGFGGGGGGGGGRGLPSRETVGGLKEQDPSKESMMKALKSLEQAVPKSDADREPAVAELTDLNSAGDEKELERLSRGSLRLDLDEKRKIDALFGLESDPKPYLLVIRSVPSPPSATSAADARPSDREAAGDEAAPNSQGAEQNEESGKGDRSGG